MSEPAAHWTLGPTLLWGVLVAAVFLGLQAATTLILIGARSANDPNAAELDALVRAAESDGTVLSIATFVTALACSALVAGIVKLKKGATLVEYLALHPVDRSALRSWLIVLIVLLLAFDLLALLLGRPIVPPFMREVYDSSHPTWLIWVALIFAAPLFEEVFFRGFLLRGFASSFLGTGGAVAATSLLWTVVHVQYDAIEMGFVFCMGLLFGAARVRSRSLLVPLVLHATANLGATLEAALLG
jgi:membrane protease YdiL (CAAX protease family)